MSPNADSRSGGHALAIEALTKDYGAGRPAVDGLSLEVAAGSFLGLLGPSGCGKTTTLRMMAGLIAPTHGRVLVAGRDITHQAPYERNMGVVFQSYALFPHMTVAQNVGFGLRVRKLAAVEAAKKVTEAIRLVRLEGHDRRRPHQLSGGQQQRVALARALVIAPDVLLLDEPLSNLDAKLREEMRVEIRDIQRRLGITTVFVTHDQAEAMALSDRIAILHDGRLAQVGSPDEIFERPASAFVARFIGRVNEWAAHIDASAGGATVRLADGRSLAVGRDLPKGPDVRVMVRPHLIEVRAPGVAGPMPFAGIVRRRTFIGDVVELGIESDGLQIIAEVRPGRDPAAAFAVGQPVELGWDKAHTMVFAT